MKKWMWITLSLFIVILDQFTKGYALHALSPYEPHALIPMVNFTLAFNTGVAFSFLSHLGEWNRWFFVGFSSLMSIVLLIWLIRLPNKYVLQAAGISLILGGALGNLYDRLMLGYVVDFIDVYYKTHHWPVFNLADSAICLGACLLLIDLKQSPSYA